MKKKMENRKRISKWMVTICAFVIALQVGVISAFAAPTIITSEYDGNGKVDVDFLEDVQYRNLKVTVKDNTGKKYKTTIVDVGDDDLDFVIRNYKEGRKYTYTIKGVRAWGERKFSSVKGKVTIPKASAAPKVKTVECDPWEDEVDFSFTKKVTWKNPEIKITSGSKTYRATITDLGDDDMEVWVNGLEQGKTYKYTITGLTAGGSSKTVKLTGSFRA